VRVSLRPLSLYPTERRCEASRLQEQILAEVYHVLVPDARRPLPSLPTVHRCQGERCIVANPPRQALGEEAA
jgi:hypothetical protein